MEHLKSIWIYSGAHKCLCMYGTVVENQLLLGGAPTGSGFFSQTGTQSALSPMPTFCEDLKASRGGWGGIGKVSLNTSRVAEPTTEYHVRHVTPFDGSCRIQGVTCSKDQFSLNEQTRSAGGCQQAQSRETVAPETFGTGPCLQLHAR